MILAACMRSWFEPEDRAAHPCIFGWIVVRFRTCRVPNAAVGWQIVDEQEKVAEAYAKLPPDTSASEPLATDALSRRRRGCAVSDSLAILVGSVTVASAA